MHFFERVGLGVLPLSSSPEITANDGGYHVQRKDQRQQHQGGSVLNLQRHAGHLRADDVQVIRQSHGLIEGRVRQARQEEGGDGKKYGGSFAAGSQQSQDDAGDNAGQRLRQHDVTDALPAG